MDTQITPSDFSHILVAQGPWILFWGNSYVLVSHSLEHLKKPVGELLMHTGETYRRIQEERELINRTLPRQRDGNVRTLFPRTLGSGWRPGHRAGLAQVSQLERKRNLSIAKPC
jgi:hypothetical protein